jgi:hypothetical protein
MEASLSVTGKITKTTARAKRQEGHTSSRRSVRYTAGQKKKQINLTVRQRFLNKEALQLLDC